MYMYMYIHLRIQMHVMTTLTILCLGVFPAYNVHMYLLHLLSDLMLNDEVSSAPTSTDQRWAALH